MQLYASERVEFTRRRARLANIDDCAGLSGLQTPVDTRADFPYSAPSDEFTNVSASSSSRPRAVSDEVCIAIR
jgi:hypothetical protein